MAEHAFVGLEERMLIGRLKGRDQARMTARTHRPHVPAQQLSPVRTVRIVARAADSIRERLVHELIAVRRGRIVAFAAESALLSGQQPADRRRVRMVAAHALTLSGRVVGRGFPLGLLAQIIVTGTADLRWLAAQEIVGDHPVRIVAGTALPA
jgi:hypothetical protein